MSVRERAQSASTTRQCLDLYSLQSEESSRSAHTPIQERGDSESSLACYSYYLSSPFLTPSFSRPDSRLIFIVSLLSSPLAFCLHPLKSWKYSPIPTSKSLQRNRERTAERQC